jgi:hypothetical protein
MAGFMRSLPSYIEGPGRTDEATGKAITLLLEVSDFKQFRDMMMFRRRELDDHQDSKHAEEQLVGARVVVIDDVEDMMEMCKEVAAADDTPSWTNIMDLDWVRVDLRPVEPEKRRNKNDVYIRIVATMNLTFEENCDVMFNYTERRKAFDDRFDICGFVKDGGHAYDSIVKLKVDFGYILNTLLFGRQGTNVTVRFVKRWDQPFPGSVTYATVPWDAENDCYDKNHSILMSLETGVISPHPTLPGKSTRTILQISSMGAMPKWVLALTFRTFVPQMLRSMESKYIANIRNKGLTLDHRPAWMVHRHKAESKDDFADSKEDSIRGAKATHK